MLPKKAKSSAVKRLNELNMKNLAKAVKKSDGLELEVFFAAKTHKVNCPLRAIVTEDGSWKKILGGFLQRQLNLLKPHDPFETRSSTDVITALQKGLHGATSAMSIDIEDLFYSVPHDERFCAIRELIDKTGVVKFQNECGVNVEAFLELVALYLSTTVVKF
ncbi:hypothetical protein HPB48_010490 [Haemaphysalis longicornis]|uniref:Tick transposon n=1 Tax=Haemaphysalis longicornis TaxID=44386 RepID=A0A9J6GCC3_HAELO|nr:hypothetical protein HPB48_010490 [Haemaphysalis longicornis]